MSGEFRTREGGRIDRARTIPFTFDGKNYRGHPGDTLASALIANGVHLMGRSFKYHRPRGLLGAGAEEPNALVSVARDAGRATPNLRATQVEIYEGLVAQSQNRFPSLAFDIGEINDIAPNIFSAGFYYKTFMAPAGAWAKLYEPFIRRAAGLGVAPNEADSDSYAHRYAFCDVLVIGAGASGLSAALSAAASGARVFLCDENAELGGGLLSERDAKIDGASAADWVARTLGELSSRENVTLLPRTQAFGYYAQNFVALQERVTDHLATPRAGAPRERLWKLRAKQVVLATGAIERPLVFPDNDRPGIMLASAARAYANQFGARVGKSILIFAADDSAYQAAHDLRETGSDIVAIADLRPKPGEVAANAAAREFTVMPATTVAATSGRLRVGGAELGRIRADGTVKSSARISCDAILMAGGWTPSVHLFSQSRGKLRFDDALGAFVPDVSAQAERSAGACRGMFGLAACVNDGATAGAAAARDAGFAGAASPAPVDVVGEIVPRGGWRGAVPHPRPPHRVKAFVDFQNDVTAKDIGLAVQEGFRSIEHVKRYTTTGMATDQGKTSNINALAIASANLAKPMQQVGLTTFRPPYTPVTFGAFAGAARGDLFDPVRETPLHAWAKSQGAVFEDVGQWKRARYFPRAGEDMRAAVSRECRAVRAGVGLFDASTLGKIEVVGPDAAAFMNLIYANGWGKLGVGRCRYGLMLSEAGFVMDDGVVARIAEDRFHVTTTTGGAARALHHMEDYRQTEFPHLKVWLTSTTEQWAVIAVQGPTARELVAPLVEEIDISREAMPHMSVRTGRIAGVRTRLFRVSFTGELGFEINVPSSEAPMVWDALWQAGRTHDAVAYGTEAMHVLRAEKGFIIVGQETDGTVTPHDLGLDGMVARSKPDFVGKRGLMRPDLVASGRKQLVGLLTADPASVLEEGAQVTREREPAKGSGALGRVTSAYFSDTLGRSIALALVADGRGRHGDTLHIPMPGGAVDVTVAAPVFFDPNGSRLDV